MLSQVNTFINDVFFILGITVIILFFTPSCFVTYIKNKNIAIVILYLDSISISLHYYKIISIFIIFL